MVVSKITIEPEGWMTRMELYELIRKEHFIEQKSLRRIAREHHVHRRDVRLAIQNAIPPTRKHPNREARTLGAVVDVIDTWLKSDQSQPRKQRHTSRRIYQRLCAEHGFNGAESTVRRHVGNRRRELGFGGREVFIEQEYQPGDEAQVDFGEAQVILGGIQVRLYLLFVRCNYSGRTQVIASHRLTQQSFLESLAHALTLFGGVFRVLRFDNLTAAVKKVLHGRMRKETERFIACRSHYLFESAFCRPGKEGAHEKGGIEGEVGRFRRQHLVPVPAFENLHNFNAYLQTCCQEDESRTMAHKTKTVGALWEISKNALRNLPKEPFDCSTLLEPRVDTKSRVQILRNFYSVPALYVGRQVTARINADVVTVLCDGKSIAVHQRLHGVMEESLVLDHYLEWLRRKPAAMPQSKVLGQTRRRGEFPACYEHLWSALLEKWDDAEGTRQLIDVLTLLRSHSEEEVTMAVEMALSSRCIDAAAVSAILRQIQAPTPIESAPLMDIGVLSRYERSAPDIKHYDRWLGKVVQ